MYMLYQNNKLLVLFIILTLVAWVIFSLIQRNRGHLPPGPPRLPFVGNLRHLTELAKPRPWYLFHKWAQEYGPLTYLNLLGKPVVIISTAQAANDLLESRAVNYSSRPRNIVGGEYTCGGFGNIVLLRSGDAWRRMRRVSEAQLAVKSLVGYEDIQTDEAVVFAYEMLTMPEKRQENTRRVTASGILSIMYGQPPLQSLDEPYVQLMDYLIHKMNQVVQPGAHLVEVIPVLEYIPTFLSPWKKSAKSDFQKLSSMFLKKYLAVKEKTLPGDERRPSVCANLLEAGARRDMNDLESAWLAATIYGAAYDTTTAALSWFFLLMVQFPRIQQKAQQEIDAVIGQSRIPSFSDMKHLPYIRALIREILRWRPPAPLGIPHESLEDDYYNGQLIPRGSICISNIWSINRDTDVYGEDADEFRPERHLGPDGKLKDERGEGNFSYGFGRRNCVGRHFANKSLFIDITMVLWAMSIEASDVGVVPALSDSDIGDGIVLETPAFECRCKPRFSGVEATLKQARDAVFLAQGASG